MAKLSSLCLYGVFAACLLSASPAAAQFQPLPGTFALDQRYWVEGGLGLWNPSADMSISSEQFGIPGDNIDFRRDLGLTDSRFRELYVTLRPATCSNTI
jgi:hypothetical protein